ncbi:MAG: hypothetical protein KME42_26650 [Tildeniella nuda ZEHNDER 1965/U140]|nr:hypothetical protein [Tildeniella nuda ZEHNDER 1965/U140]
MANSHSYLQTLAKDEASTFVASLQKVKEHLSHELQQINEQIQQKTLQLQGIETLLLEAAGLGLAPHTTSTPNLTASNNVNAAMEDVPFNAVSTTVSPLDRTTVAANSNHLAANTAASTVSSPPPKRTKQRQQSKPSQSKRDATKLPTVGKTSAAKTEKPARSIPSSSDGSKASLSGFQTFLQTNFQNKSMTESVGEILESAKEPLNTDAIMAELYHGLPGEAYDRAKSSLSNILSVGKTKGKWQSPARGMYVGNAAAPKAK